MPHRFEQQLAADWPPETWCDVTVVVAVSGGADSVALLRALHRLATAPARRLLVAHFNHQLRGPDAEADQHFVGTLAADLRLECLTGTAATADLARRRGDGLEEAGRAARYAWLKSAAQHRGARFVVTAHNMEDQAETIMYRVLRGTGLAGLAGMPRTRRLGTGLALIRPMLGIRRREILDYLNSLKQPYRQDASNLDPSYARNRLRHEWFPRIAEDFNPRVVEALVRMGRLAAEAKQAIAELVSPLLDRAVVQSQANLVEIDCRQVWNRPAYLVRELLMAVWRDRSWPEQAMGYDEWTLLAAMVLQQAPAATEQKRPLPGGVLACRKADRLVLLRQGCGQPTTGFAGSGHGSPVDRR